MYKVVESEHESYCSSPANENWDQGVEGGEAWEADMSKGHQTGDQWKMYGASSVLFYGRDAKCVPNCG